MKKSVLLILALTFQVIAMAQSDQTLFSNSGIKLTGIWAGNTSNLNEDNGDYGVFHGGYFMAEFNKSLTIGYQSYGLNDQGLEMDYKGLHIGYAHQPWRVIHPTISLFTGGGKLKSRSGEHLRDDVFALQPALGLEMNVVKWFRLGLEGGYRFVFDTDIPGYNDSQVSEPYLGLRLKFGFSWGD